MKTWHILVIVGIAVLVIIYFVNQQSKAKAAAQQAQMQSQLAANDGEAPDSSPYQSYVDLAGGIIGLFGQNKGNSGSSQQQNDIAWCKKNPAQCRTWCKGQGKAKCDQLCKQYPSDCKAILG